MKKILIIFTLLFSFSFLAYGQKLIDSYFDEETGIKIEEYDNKFSIIHKYWGGIVIQDNNISILAKDMNTNDTNILISLKNDGIYVFCNKDYFDSKPNSYFLSKEKYKIGTVLDEKEGYAFLLPKEHFNKIKNNGFIMIPTLNNNEGYTIFNLISMAKFFDEKLNKYSLYNKYLK